MRPSQFALLAGDDIALKGFLSSLQVDHAVPPAHRPLADRCHAAVAAAVLAAMQARSHFRYMYIYAKVSSR